MTNITNWQSPHRPFEKKSMTCISILQSSLKAFRKKYPEASFSAFVQQKLQEELENK